MNWSAAKSMMFRLVGLTPRVSAPAPVIEPQPILPVTEVEDPLVESGAFDPDWYLFRYPDLASFGASPVAHFREFGYGEARDPTPYLSLSKFFLLHPDARFTSVDAAMGAVRDAPLDEQEALLPDDSTSFAYLLHHHHLFDETWYAARNPDLAGEASRLIDHFTSNGAREQREPGPNFDSELYRATYPHSIERYASAVEDYVRVGARRGYAPMGLSKYQRWIATFDTLTADDIERLKTEARDRACRIVAVHVLDSRACEYAAEIVAAWDERLDIAATLHLVRASDVTDAAWDACLAAAHDKVGIETRSAPEMIRTLPPGAVVVLCGGPVLVRPHAATELAALLQRTGCTAAYCDHDVVDAHGVRGTPSFKPDMSPTFMRQVPYVGGLIAALVTESSAPNLADALRRAREGAIHEAWADVLLAAGTGQVAHAPFILYHEIAGPEGSPRGRGAEPVPDGTSALPSVSVIIPTRDRVALLRACLDSIAQYTDYPAERIEVVIVDNDSREAETLAYLAEVEARERVSLIRVPGLFNFSVVCNAGAARASGELLVFLNNDMTVNRRDWLGRLAGEACRPGVGLVGAELLFPDGQVQHGGTVLGIQGVGAHRLAEGDIGPAGTMMATRETVAVTGACLAVQRAMFERFGGFDPALGVAFNDVKLCIQAHEAGLRNIYIGEPLLFHHESQSRGFDDTPFKRHRNAREAIYVRERHDALFRNDPFYSPNLSLQAVDRLGMPPRTIRPWRRSPAHQPRVLLLSTHHGIGYGVAVVLQQQAAYLRERGWTVFVGGPIRPREMRYEGCARVDLWTAEAAASYAVAEGIDVIVAHTDPFFSIGRYLGAFPLLYFTDHGEPPPRLFVDAEQREGLDWEKRFCAPMARRVFTISETIKASQFRADAVVLRNGNAHLSTWSDDWKARRGAVRSRLGLCGRFVVLNVCRFGASDRIYKGVNHYAEIASDLGYLQPQTPIRAHFILAGRGEDEDAAEMRSIGVDVHANPTDADLTDLYAASDLYMSFSQWEGYNLGVGQALAMGLDVIASDIAAHREFGVEVSDSVMETCRSLARHMAAWTEDADGRTAVVHPWATPLETMVDYLEADLAAARSS